MAERRAGLECVGRARRRGRPKEEVKSMVERLWTRVLVTLAAMGSVALLASVLNALFA
jgi:hypothetical protein